MEGIVTYKLLALEKTIGKELAGSDCVGLGISHDDYQCSCSARLAGRNVRGKYATGLIGLRVIRELRG